ncbi:MAG: S41 family peptidase, partial [Pyrinomonadaceae bacterium]
MKIFSLLLLITLFAAVEANAQTSAVLVPAAAPTNVELRRQTFEQVWRTVRDKHFDPTLGGLDWNKIHEKYEPQLTSIKTDTELYTMLQSMIGELGQSHFNIIPPTAVVEDQTKASVEGEIGVDLQIIGGEALITKVNVGSPAEIAGIRAGYVVRAIEGKPIAELLAKLNERLRTRKETDELKRLIMSRVVLHLIDGAAGTTSVLQLLNEQGQVREFKVVRSEIKGEMSPAFGNFPAQHIEFETKRLESNIGYIRFNIWVIPQMAKIRAAMGTMGDATGLIIDLRGNPGGIGGMASGVAGMLSSEQFSLGKMKMRSGEIYFTAFPQPEPINGPVVILTDAGSASTSEV